MHSRVLGRGLPRVLGEDRPGDLGCQCEPSRVLVGASRRAGGLTCGVAETWGLPPACPRRLRSYVQKRERDPPARAPPATNIKCIVDIKCIDDFKCLVIIKCIDDFKCIVDIKCVVDYIIVF